MTARVDPSEDEATRTPVHEPRSDGPLTHDSLAHESWEHETPDQHTAGWGTWPDQPEGPSGHAGGGGEPTDGEDEVDQGGTVYQRGCTRLPSMPANPEQRWLIIPDGER